MSEAAILVTLLLFQIKHYLADFHWQTLWMINGKKAYGGGGALAHAGIHALLSLPILLWTGAGLGLALGLALVEWGAHYHIDWLKAWAERRSRATTRDRRYWRLFGLDQAAHQITYLGMVWALLVFLPAD